MFGVMFTDELPADYRGWANTDHDLYDAVAAGMFARGEFELGKSAGLTLPQEAVVLRDGNSYVFRVKPDSRVVQVKVQVGRRLGDRVEITGLDAAATVAGPGAGFLNDGDLVKVVAAPK